MQFNANFTRFMQLPMQNICMNAIHCFHSPLDLNFTDIQYRSQILRMMTMAYPCRFTLASVYRLPVHCFPFVSCSWDIWPIVNVACSSFMASAPHSPESKRGGVWAVSPPCNIVFSTTSGAVEFSKGKKREAVQLWNGMQRSLVNVQPRGAEVSADSWEAAFMLYGALESCHTRCAPPGLEEWDQERWGIEYVKSHSKTGAKWQWPKLS